MASLVALVVSMIPCAAIKAPPQTSASTVPAPSRPPQNPAPLLPVKLPVTTRCQWCDYQDVSLDLNRIQGLFVENTRT